MPTLTKSLPARLGAALVAASLVAFIAPFSVQPASATSTRELLKEASQLKDETPFSSDAGLNSADRMQEWLDSDRSLTPGTPYFKERRIALLQLVENGYDVSQWPCVDRLIWHESGWNKSATSPYTGGEFDPNGTWGLPQANPAKKMASAGKNYRTSAATQLKWFYTYIGDTYGSPCQAWEMWMERANTGDFGWY